MFSVNPSDVFLFFFFFNIQDVVQPTCAAVGAARPRGQPSGS
jgi:hypothetical protein